MHRTAFLVLAVLAVSGRGHTDEALNSVLLVLGYQIDEVVANPEIKEVLFELIVNYTSLNCLTPRQDCTLVPQYSRSSGQYKREITQADFQFSRSGLHELTPPYRWTSLLNANKTGTGIIFYLKTNTGYDFLKWTELVRIIYMYRRSISSEFMQSVKGNLSDVPLFIENPSSYIARVIDTNVVTPAIIAGVILGSAFILFVVLIPLSNTKYCRKDLEEDYEAPEKEVESG